METLLHIKTSVGGKPSDNSQKIPTSGVKIGKFWGKSFPELVFSALACGGSKLCAGGCVLVPGNLGKFLS